MDPGWAGDTRDDFDASTDGAWRSAHDRSGTIGRYALLSCIGAGGMGVVYAAYDPELDRRIALKLLHPRREGAHDGLARLTREAQALAKLSHPNVVAVHDVGEHDGATFIAMELVAGCTLRQWLDARARSVTEVLTVLLQAGEGLAAAHAKGLVHRDFKPDNVIVGDDGRTRVMDFGLARSGLGAAERTDTEASPAAAIGRSRGELTRAGAVLGTPRYMSPEQLAAAPVGPAADQFAFCLVAHEALYGESAFEGASIHARLDAVTRAEVRAPPAGHQVPTWLRRVVLRGLAPQPHARWPSMRALLDAMAQGPRTRGRRWLTLAASMVALAAVLGVGPWLQHRRAQHCAEQAETLTSSWNTGRAEALEAAMIATGITHAADSAARVIAQLDRHADAWSQLREQVCLSSGDAGTSEAAPVVACLDEHAAELDAFVERLLAPDDGVVHAAVAASHELSPSTSCRVATDSRSGGDAGATMRDELVHARVHAWLGDFAAAASLAGRVRDEARQWAARPREAEALLELGAAQVELGQYGEAESTLRASVELSGAIGADTVAADAARNLSALVGSLGRGHEGLLWSAQAQMWLDRAGEPDASPRRGLVLQARAIVELTAGDTAAATVTQAQAYAVLAAALGPQHPATAQALLTRGRIAQAAGDHATALVDLSQALELQQQAFGVGHPATAAALSAYGQALDEVGRPREAIEPLRSALELLEQIHGVDSPPVAQAAYALAHAVGPSSEALALLDRATTIYTAALGPEHIAVAMCANELGLIELGLGHAARAQQHFVRAIALTERVPGSEDATLARMSFNLGRAARALGDHDLAQSAFDRAAAMSSRTPSTSP